MIELATRGLPVVGLATDQFDRFGRQVLQQRNAGALRLAVIAHPLGGIPAAEARARVTEEVLAAVVRALTAADGGAER
ncbi:MAG TPA: hypothetical protein VL049_19580 [Candidatus Dormibacteraeota bacterium]|nr:hypothetical protein [Candidatus Dormibacteraeota bacterium]